MRIKPGKLDEYRYHHDHIWPEMVAEIERSGIASMTIFASEPQLFLFSEIRDEDAWDRLWHSETHKRWGELMENFLEFGDNGLIDAHELREVFHIES